MHFCESWEFLASSTILLRMAPCGTLRLAAIFQEVEDLCALMKSQRIWGKGKVTIRMDIRNLVIPPSHFTDERLMGEEVK